MFTENGGAMRRFVARLFLFLFILLLSAGIAVYFARERVLRHMGHFLVIEQPVRRADAIVMLSGSIPDRILEAVDLYKEGLAPRLILTQEGALPGAAALRAKGATLPEHHELNLSVADQLGVPRAAINLVTTPAWSTLTEAQAIIDYLKQERLHTVILVTSKAHTRRAHLTYEQLGKGELEFIVRPSRYDPFDPDTWWQRRPYVRRVVIEYIKLLNYLLLDRWKQA